MFVYLLTRSRWAATLLLAVIGVLLADHAFAVSTTDVIEAFKYTYGSDRLIYLASQEVVLWRILSRRPKPVGGRGQWILPFQTQDAGVWVGHAEGGAKTTRRAQPDTAEMTFSLQEFHGIWDISWKMLQDARKDEYSFARAIDFMDQSMRRRVFRLLNADLLGSGVGELGILSAADNQTTITVRSLPLAAQGMIVDLMDASDNTTALAAARTVTAVDVQNRTITFSGAAPAGTAAGDYFNIADSNVSATVTNHLIGIRAWIDSANPAAIVGNIGGTNRSTAGNEWAQASELGNSGTNRPLTEDLLLQGHDLVRERGGAEIDHYLSNLPLLRRYHGQLREDVFFALGSISPLGDGVGLGRAEGSMQKQEGNSGEPSNATGKTPYKFSGIPWHAEPYMDANTILGFASEHYFIGHGENEVPQPLSEIFGDDMTPFFTTTGNTTFEVVSYWQGELLCDNPMAGIKWADIAES